MLTFLAPVAALNSDMKLDSQDFQFINTRSNNSEKETNRDKNSNNTNNENETESFQEYKKYSIIIESNTSASNDFENEVKIIHWKNFKTESLLKNLNNENLNNTVTKNLLVANYMDINMLCNTAHSSKFNCCGEDKKNLNYEIVSKPNYGKIKINCDGTFTYLPYINFCGRDSLSYVVTDGKHKSNIATIIINVSNK